MPNKFHYPQKIFRWVEVHPWKYLHESRRLLAQQSSSAFVIESLELKYLMNLAAPLYSPWPLKILANTPKPIKLLQKNDFISAAQ